MQEPVFSDSEIKERYFQMQQEYIQAISLTAAPQELFDGNEYTRGIYTNEYGVLEKLIQIKTNFEVESLNTPWSRSVVKRDYSKEVGFIGFTPLL